MQAVILEALNNLLSQYYGEPVKAVESEESSRKTARTGSATTGPEQGSESCVTSEEPCSKRARIEEEAPSTPALSGLNIEIIEVSEPTVEKPETVFIKCEEVSTSGESQPSSQQAATSIESQTSSTSSQQAASSIESFDLSLLSESHDEQESLVELTEDDEIALAELEKLYYSDKTGVTNGEKGKIYFEIRLHCIRAELLHEESRVRTLFNCKYKYFNIAIQLDNKKTLENLQNLNRITY